MKICLKIFLVLLINNVSLYAPNPILCFNNKMIKHKLMQLISNERECVKVAMYMFTDKDVAKKLIEARKRGVRVEIIVDDNTLRSSYGMADNLRENDIPVMCRTSLPFASCMHLKHWLFKSTRLNDKYVYRPCIFTGSCNATHNGHYRNDEMMVLVFGKYVFDRSNENFKKLKKDSKYISKN